MIESEYENLESGENITAVIIKIQDEKYLIEVETVKEIYVPGDSIIPVPLADKSIVGVINIRGIIYSIISLRHNICTSNLDYELNDHSRILLLEWEDLNIALLVDSVTGVREFRISIFKTIIDFKFIKLSGVFQEEPLILLDLNTLIQPYIKAGERKIEKKTETISIIPEKPKVIPKVSKKTKEPDISSTETTVIVPQTSKKPQLTKTPIPEKVILSADQKDILK